MDRTRFTALLEEKFEQIRKLNSTKGVEYSGHADVLSDFREVAEQVGVSPEQALITYMTKHWRAINHFVQNGATLSEPIEGRIDDLVLYGLLLVGMIRDKGTVDEFNYKDYSPAAEELHVGEFLGLTLDQVDRLDQVCKRVYIAGPMTPTRFDEEDRSDHAYEPFHTAEARLTACGIVAYNPATNSRGGVDDSAYTPRTPEEWSSYGPAEYTVEYRRVMERDIRWILECDGVALLPGWRKSQGAQFEHGIACFLHKEISNVQGWVDYATGRRAKP